MLRSTYLHSGWEFAEESWADDATRIGVIRANWLPAQVPGHVHLDLVENGVIADPFVRMNELGCQWVDEKSWLYRTTFDWRLDESLPRRVLRFEGLDTIATIFLNGDEIGRGDNMFVPLELDVTDKLREGTNEVQVHFASAVIEGSKRRTAYLAKEKLPDNVANLDERAFVRKAQYMFGWDWGPRLVSCGIWKPVRLIEYAARILDVHVTQHWQEDGLVEVRVACETEGKGDLALSLFGPDGEVSQSEPGLFDIAKPHKWWPNGLGTGNPALYRLEVSLEGAGDDHDSATVLIGLRTIKLLRESDGHGEPFEFEVNGERIWARGANWIPDHSFPSMVSEKRFRERIQDAWQLGCNMLRVWGGGLYESKEFYEHCDRHGLLVWQDFPFACSYYPDDLESQQIVADEAYENIKRLRNHPSLALWCANNENQMMWHGKWGGKDRSPDRHHGAILYEKVIPGVLSMADPSRPYIEGSPIWGSKENDSVDPNEGGSGDQHYWDVWHGRGDWRHYSDSTARYCSEYGFASSCSREVWDTVLDSSDELGSPAHLWHDKTGKPWTQFLDLVKLHYPEPKTLDDWIYYSQLNQRDAIRFGLEHFRRSEFCKGSLIWQLNDCWPVQSWALIDYKGNYKAAAYELYRLHEDDLYSIVREKELVKLWAINDHFSDCLFQGGLEVRDTRTGKRLRWSEYQSSLDRGERKIVAEISLEGLSVPDVLITAGGATNQSWQLATEPKAARFAEPGTLVLSTHMDGILRILTETPLVDLRLTAAGSTKPFIDNFLTFPSPGVFDVQIWQELVEIEARSLAGVHDVRIVRGPLSHPEPR